MKSKNDFLFSKPKHFFSKARGTGTEREPKAGVEWRCPALSKKNNWPETFKLFFSTLESRTKGFFKQKISQKKIKLYNPRLFFSDFPFCQKKLLKLFKDSPFFPKRTQKTKLYGPSVDDLFFLSFWFCKVSSFGTHDDDCSLVPVSNIIINVFCFLHGSLHGDPSLSDPLTKADHVIGVGTFEWDLAFNIF